MSMEGLYKIIIEKRKAAVEDWRQKSMMCATIHKEIRASLNLTMSELKGCIEAYEDLICLIAEKNNFTLPNFNCCEE